MPSTINLSIVIPIYNEQDTLSHLFSRLGKLKKIPKPFEIILVDDGSSDDSLRLIKKQVAKNKDWHYISLTRNFGQQPALAAGLSLAKGRWVGIIDADLQDPPEKLLDMLNTAKKEKLDIVYAVRVNRKESFLKKMSYDLFYKVYKILAENPVHPDSGDYGVLSRRVVDQLNDLPEQIKFFRGLRSWSGYKAKAYPIEREERIAGTPKYSLHKLLQLAFSGIISTSTRPLKVATFLGMLLSFAAVALGIIYLALSIFSHIREEVPGFVTLVVLLLFFSGLQLFTLGIIGEYLATIFLEVKKRPSFLIGETSIKRKIRR